MEDIKTLCRPNVEHWLDLNLPVKQDSWKTDLELNYPDMWHSDGRVLTSDDFAVDGHHYYIGVTDESICIYEDTFGRDFLENPIYSYAFHQNFMPLLAKLKHYTAVDNMDKFIEDIYTILNSGKI